MVHLIFNEIYKVSKKYLELFVVLLSLLHTFCIIQFIYHFVLTYLFNIYLEYFPLYQQQQKTQHTQQKIQHTTHTTTKSQS